MERFENFYDANGAMFTRDLFCKVLETVPSDDRKRIAFCLMSVGTMQAYPFDRIYIDKRPFYQRFLSNLKHRLAKDYINCPIRQEFGYPDDRVTFRDKTGDLVFVIGNLKGMPKVEG